ncbi:ABC transporter permease [Clostridium sp. 'deep sea']|uniref:ABC transporter permease n=1 Tax=Clostridium sp. 'deep sea' TaxID=2779445 RepID=UPI0018967065|nr:ABC transporter permease [Clostridium sp. 'deep sea']QOR34045.1 ABC transporter permease [Clostridium sp. 'deep sea']
MNIKKMFRMLFKRKTALIGFIILVIVISTALLAPLIAPYDPNASSLKKRLLPPSWEKGGSKEHFLGTDPQGRDILSRIIFGTRVSLLVGIVTVLIAGTIGTFLGLLAGYYRGTVDNIIMRLAEIQLAFPFILLALAIMAVLGAGLKNVIIVLSITGWVIYSRLVRGEVLLLRELEYVKAAKALGQKDLKIMVKHILPNILPTIIVVGTLRVANMIIAESSLTFLGLGVESGIPTWGSMLADGRDYITNAWWVATFPGIAIMVTVLGINLLGDWLRDVLDPRMKSY